MRASHYAKALFELAGEHPQKASEYATKLAAMLREHGDEHLLPKIVRALERMEARAERQRTITVATATDISEEEVGSLLRKEPFKHLLSSKHRKVVRKRDDSLIGGAVVTAGSLRVDASYKRGLIDLYHHITD